VGVGTGNPFGRSLLKYDDPGGETKKGSQEANWTPFSTLGIVGSAIRMPINVIFSRDQQDSPTKKGSTTDAF